MGILTKRPSNMEFEKFRELLKIQNQNIKRYLRGRLYFQSSFMVNIGSEMVPKWAKSKPEFNKTFVGDTRNLTSPV